MSTDMEYPRGEREWYWRMENKRTSESTYVGPFKSEEEAQQSWNAYGAYAAFQFPPTLFVLASIAAFPEGFHPSHTQPVPTP